MERKGFYMVRHGACEINALADQIEKAVKNMDVMEMELVSRHQEQQGEASIVLFVFEKYYFRVSSYVTLTMLLTSLGDKQTAYVVGSGGGSGLCNWSYGANDKIAKEAKKVLEECSFTVEV